MCGVDQKVVRLQARVRFSSRHLSRDPSTEGVICEDDAVASGPRQLRCILKYCIAQLKTKKLIKWHEATRPLKLIIYSTRPKKSQARLAVSQLFLMQNLPPPHPPVPLPKLEKCKLAMRTVGK